MLIQEDRSNLPAFAPRQLRAEFFPGLIGLWKPYAGPLGAADASGFGTYSGARSNLLGRFPFHGYYIDGSSELSVVGTPEGLAWSGDGSTQKGWNSAVTTTSTGPFSYLVQFRPRAVSGPQIIFGRFNQGLSPVWQYGNGFLLDGTTLRAVSSFNNTSQNATFAGVEAGVLYTAVMTRLGSTVKLWVNGTPSSASCTDPVDYVLGWFGTGHDPASFAALFNGTIRVSAYWGAALADGDAFALSCDPDLLFEPEELPYFFTTGGGGTLISVSDTATGSDAIAIAVGVALTDTATGSDSLGMGASVPVTDSAAGSDTITISVALQVDDSSAGSDAVSVLTEILKSVTDSAVGSDAVSVNVSLTQTDSATGTDTVGIAVTLTIADSATGSDAISVLQAMLISVADACTGTDTIGGIAVSVQLSDAGFATELVAITALVQVLESCSGMDVVVTLQPGGTRIVQIRFTPRSRAMRFTLRGRDMTFTLH